MAKISGINRIVYDQEKKEPRRYGSPIRRPENIRNVSKDMPLYNYGTHEWAYEYLYTKSIGYENTR